MFRITARRFERMEQPLCPQRSNDVKGVVPLNVSLFKT